jgi:hypothetical protein
MTADDCPDDDPLDDALNDPMFSFIVRAFREGAVRRCLSGSDTGCFTVEDYMRACDGAAGQKKEIEKFPRLALSREWAVKHLRSLPDLVKEVRPGVWSAT